MPAETTRLYLIRHGEVEARYQRVFGGRIDMELSPQGLSQAEALAKHLRPVRFAAIYSSPMKRAAQTVVPLVAGRSLSPVTLDDLREVDFGAWTGLTWEQVQERFGVSAFDWLEKLDKMGVPEAETAEQFRARIEPCLKRIISDDCGQTVAVVCHGGVIRMMLAVLLDLPLPKLAHFDIEYASVTVVNCAPHRAELHLLNFTTWRVLP
jgi:broad specificity phosphatase PhoE